MGALNKKQTVSYLQSVVDIIGKSGFAVQGVGGGENTPTYSYSVGLSLTTKNPYELVMLGLNPATAGNIINAVTKKIQKNKLILTDGFIFTDICSAPIKLKKILPDQVKATCTVVGKLMRNFDQIEFFQLIWPDIKGRYPEELECDALVVIDQDIELLENSMS